MPFELPFPPFPHDSRDVPFIATPDDNNGYAVPSSQYFKKLVGDKYVWTPVSSDDPMPSSDVAAQAQLAEILAKLSADPATQTTLAAILAKIITAPATEAKQTALNALIGEVQAAPTANTLLARLKNLETKVDAIIADGVKLSGSIVTVSIVDDLSPVTIPAGSVSIVPLDPPASYNYTSYDLAFYSNDSFLNAVTVDVLNSANKFLPPGSPPIPSSSKKSGSISKYSPPAGSKIRFNFYNQDTVAHDVYRYVAGRRWE